MLFCYETGNDVDIFDPTDFAVKSNDVNLQEILAKGSYGMVYKGTYKGQQVALKYQTLPGKKKRTFILFSNGSFFLFTTLL